MADVSMERRAVCRYVTVLMKSGYRVDIGVESGEGGRDSCYVAVSGRDDVELLVLGSDSAPPNLHPDYICEVVRQILDVSIRGKPFKELATLLEVALTNLRIYVNPDDVSLVFFSLCVE